MNTATSLYLDAVRFLAALSVLITHAHGQAITGGFLWQLAPYGAEAVTVFFVLSGFVIAHATAAGETTLRDYSIARVSRIYSVVIPALVLTALADAIGRSISSEFYSAATHYHPDAYRFITAALFVNQLWGLDIMPGSNWAYWSLGYEVWYYALFGALIFFSGRQRIVLVLVIMMIVGPAILAMWPLWFIGVWAYRLPPLGRRDGIALFAISLIAWAAYEAAAWRFGRPHLNIGFLKRPELLQDYIVAACFTGSLVGLRSAMEGVQVRHRWRLVRWLAGATFSLYLFHEPLVRLLATVNPWEPGSWSGRAFVLGLTLLMVFSLAEVTERRKAGWRRLVSWCFAQRQLPSDDQPLTADKPLRVWP
jgi:peptidoglycan/LPS O-acetylase OafA/YrhL